MKRDLTKRMGIFIPADGLTQEERVLTDLINNNVIETLYGKLPTTRMKAIVAMHFELGYDQETLGQVFGVTQEQVALDIRNIKKVLKGDPYRPHKRKVKIAYEDLMSMCRLLAQA